MCILPCGGAACPHDGPHPCTCRPPHPPTLNRSPPATGPQVVQEQQAQLSRLCEEVGARDAELVGARADNAKLRMEVGLLGGRVWGRRCLLRGRAGAVCCVGPGTVPQ